MRPYSITLRKASIDEDELPLLCKQAQIKKYLKLPRAFLFGYDSIRNEMILPFLKRNISYFEHLLLEMSNLNEHTFNQLLYLIKTRYGKYVRRIFITQLNGNQEKKYHCILKHFPNITSIEVDAPYINCLKYCRTSKQIKFSYDFSDVAILLNQLPLQINRLRYLEHLSITMRDHDESYSALRKIKNLLSKFQVQPALDIEIKPRNWGTSTEDSFEFLEGVNALEVTFDEIFCPNLFLNTPNIAQTLKKYSIYFQHEVNNEVLSTLKNLKNLEYLKLDIWIKAQDYSNFFKNCTFPSSLQTLSVHFYHLCNKGLENREEVDLQEFFKSLKYQEQNELGIFSKEISKLQNLNDLRFRIRSTELKPWHAYFAALFLENKKLEKIDMLLGDQYHQQENSLNLSTIISALKSSASTLKNLIIDINSNHFGEWIEIPCFRNLSKIEILLNEGSTMDKMLPLITLAPKEVLKRLHFRGSFENDEVLVKFLQEVSRYRYLTELNLALSVKECQLAEEELGEGIRNLSNLSSLMSMRLRVAGCKIDMQELQTIQEDFSAKLRKLQSFSCQLNSQKIRINEFRKLEIDYFWY